MVHLERAFKRKGIKDNCNIDISIKQERRRRRSNIYDIPKHSNRCSIEYLIQSDSTKESTLLNTNNIAFPKEGDEEEDLQSNR